MCKISTTLPPTNAYYDCQCQQFTILYLRGDGEAGLHNELQSIQSQYTTENDVAIAFIKGVTIALSCQAGKIPYNQICFLTSFEPDKVYLGPNRNNKEVAIIYCSGPKYPLLDFLLLVLLVLRAALPSLPPPPSFIIETPSLP